MCVGDEPGRHGLMEEQYRQLNFKTLGGDTG